MSFYYYYYYNKLLIFSLKSEIFWNKPIARYSRLPNNINFPLQFITSNKIVAKNPSINYARYIFISADFIGFFIMSSRTLCRMHANAIHNEKKILIHFCFVLFYFFPCIFFFFKCIRSVGPKIDLKHDNWACLFVCFVLDQRIVKERSLTCWIAVVFCMSELKIQFNLHANSQHFSLCIWTKKKSNWTVCLLNILFYTAMRTVFTAPVLATHSSTNRKRIESQMQTKMCSVKLNVKAMHKWKANFGDKINGIANVSTFQRKYYC